jgi:hypothetical protein
LVVEPRPGQGQAACIWHRVHHHVLIDALHGLNPGWGARWKLASDWDGPQE